MNSLTSLPITLNVGMTVLPSEPKQAAYTNRPLHRYPRWAVRFWHGMDFFTWIRLLVRNRFAVPPVRWSMVATVTLPSILNTFAGVFEWFLFSSAVRRVKLKEPPLFVLGHWRSGTTLLHELLMLDPRHQCPTTYQCFAPHHFLWTSWFLPPLARLFLPKKRPMDDVVAGWDRPQEDEFALANMGVPSPYLAWAFPNHGPVADEYLDLRTLPTAERETWKRKWRGFVQRHRAREQSPHRAEIADAHRPRAHDSGSLPRREVHSHRARSARAVSVHRAIVEVAQRSAGLSNPAR